MGEPNAALSAMSVLAAAWRGDWSDFDGRTLRAQLADLDRIIRKEVRGEDVRGDIAAFYASCDLCPQCMSWTEWCDHPSPSPV